MPLIRYVKGSSADVTVGDAGTMKPGESLMVSDEQAAALRAIPGHTFEDVGHAEPPTPVLPEDDDTPPLDDEEG